MDVHVQPVTDINDANVLLQLHHHLDSNMATEKNHATDLSEANPMLQMNTVEHKNVGHNKTTMESEVDHATNLSDGNDFCRHNKITQDSLKDQRCLWYPYCQKMASICSGW